MTADARFSFLVKGGEAAEHIRHFDWSSTSLGPLEDWPISLRTSVGTILTSAIPAAVVWGPDRITLHNDAFRTILSEKPVAIGRPYPEVWADIWDEIGPMVEKARAGEATFVEDFPLDISRNGQREAAFYTFCCSPLRDDAGELAGMLDTVVETTSRVETERRVRLMNAELQHRMKNMFATVNSIVSQTLRTQRTPDEIRPLLLQRMATLANAHAMVTEASADEVDIRKVLDGALKPYCTDANRFRLQGRSLLLSEKQALSLSLTLNELATNATKYGPLSQDNGHVEIAWRGDRNDAFCFVWREQGGPPVKPPERRGFGRTLMERVAPHDFGGSGMLTYAPDGLIYTLETDRLPR